MAGVWSTPSLDLTLPSNGRLVPGSGTVYVGGPRLPAKLKAAGAKGAIVFYSASVDSYANYYYLAYINVSGPYYTFDLGYEDAVTGFLRSRFSTTASKVQGATTITGPEALPGYEAKLELSFLGAILQAPRGHLSFYSGGSGFNPGGDNDVSFTQYDTSKFILRYGNTFKDKLTFDQLSTTAPVMKADVTNTLLDQWFTDTSTQTVGGKTSTVIWDWRQTPDYIVEARLRVVPNTPPFNASFALNPTAPAAMPKPDSGPGTGNFVNSWGNVGAYNGAQVIPLTGRLNATGIADIFSQGLANLRDFSGAFVYTAAKP